MMTKRQIRKMLKDVVCEIDYDIYKSMFVKDCQEDPEGAVERINRLIEIVQEHLAENTGS